MIEFKDINLIWQDNTIFHNFSFHVKAGEKVWINAPSGSGKTSLINMMMGFVKPTSGHIIIEGKELGKSTVADIRSSICYLGQDASLPSGLVSDVISEVGAFKFNRNKDFSNIRMEELFAQYGMSMQTLQRNVETLSGGERQRLAFIICMMLDRDIWLLDEITTGLDVDNKKRMMDEVVSSQKTIVMISHDTAWSAYEQLRKVSFLDRKEDK